MAETTPGAAASPPTPDDESAVPEGADSRLAAPQTGAAESPDGNEPEPADHPLDDADVTPVGPRYELVPRRSGLLRRDGRQARRAGELVRRARRVATHPVVVASGAAVGTLAARAGLVALQRVVVRNAAAQVAAQAAGQLAGRPLGGLATQPTGALVTRTLGQLAQQPPPAPAVGQPVGTATHVLVRLVVIVRQPWPVDRPHRPQRHARPPTDRPRTITPRGVSSGRAGGG